MKNRVRLIILVLSAISLELSGCGKSDSSVTTTLQNSHFEDAQGGCANGGFKLEVLVNGVVDETRTLYTCNGPQEPAGTNTNIRTTIFDGAQDHCSNGGSKVEVLVDGLVDDSQTQYVCNGENGHEGQNGQHGHYALVATSDDVGANCVQGGIRIDAGLDANDDGTLDADEILGTRYVCHGVDGENGTDGKHSAIQTTSFDGVLDDHCSNGGIKIEVLLDNVVQEGQSQYICNGAVGSDGRNGLDGHLALVDTSDEVGERCAHGGIRVDAGLDTDDDGALDGSEVLNTQYVCYGADGEKGTDGKPATVQTTSFEGVLDDHCANGGIKIEVLLDDEVQEDLTQYICHGANGRDGQNGQDSHLAIVDTSDEVGEKCAHGGIRVDTGLDTNGDGALDDNEILDTQYVCHGGDGENGTDGKHATVHAVTFEGVLDDHCSNGGIKIEVLLDNEVQEDQTQYICHGENGHDGQNGQDSLLAIVDTSDEVGEKCAHGGIRVDTGLDTDGSGALEDGEILSTQYICNGGDGENGTDGKHTTIHTTSFEGVLDDHCSNGGIKIEVLLDNEVLEEQTQYICNGIPCNVANAKNEYDYETGECKFTCNDGYVELDGACVPAFITKWDVTAENLTVKFPIQGREGTIVIDWGDGTRDTVSTGTSKFVQHTYSSADMYTITAIGTINEWSCLRIVPEYSYRCSDNRNDSYCQQLVEVQYYGDVTFGRCAFHYSKLNHIPEEGTPRFRNNEMIGVFYYAEEFNQDIEFWDTSNITSMEVMFSHASSFNQPLNNWNVSNVKAMRSMFYEASSFDQPLNDWDTSSVTGMHWMFFEASSFNQPLNGWKVSGVTDMMGLFNGAASFNQPLDNWDVSSVTDMDAMFKGASSFNQPLDTWDVSSVTTMSKMFENAGLDAENYCALFKGAYADIWTRFKSVLGISFDTCTD